MKKVCDEKGKPVQLTLVPSVLSQAVSAKSYAKTSREKTEKEVEIPSLVPPFALALKCIINDLYQND